MNSDDDLDPALACEYLATWGLRPRPGGMTPAAEMALTILNLVNAVQELERLTELRCTLMLPGSGDDIRFTVAVRPGQLYFLTCKQAAEAFPILRHSPGRTVFLHLAAARGWHLVCKS